MAREWYSGGELGDMSELTFANDKVWVQTTIKRSGAYAYRINVSNGGAGFGLMYKEFTAAAEKYFRNAFYHPILTGSSPQAPLYFASGATALVSIDIDYTNRVYVAKVGSTIVATGTAKITVGGWDLLEIHVKIADAGGVIEVKVNGFIDISYTGDTKPGAETTISRVYWQTIDRNLGAGVDTYVDDIAINDTSGSADNSWCGDGRILFRPTNGAGDQSGFTPSAGLNYQCVDDVPNNGDTDYVDGTTLDTYDLYQVANSALVTDDVILRMRVVAVAKDTVANGGKIALGLKTGGTEYWGDDKPLTTNYTDVYGTEHLINPQTGVAWTVADLDALQVGEKARGN